MCRAMTVVSEPDPAWSSAQENPKTAALAKP